jgi:hypothetical protein
VEDYTNDSGYGASDWVAVGSTIPPQEENEDTQSYRHAIARERAFFEVTDPTDMTDPAVIVPEFFHGNDMKDRMTSDMADENGVIDITDWD